MKTDSEAGPRESRGGAPARVWPRIAVVVLALAAYAVLMSAAVIRDLRHYEWLGIFLQYMVALPAIIYCLRAPGAGSAISLPGPRIGALALAFFLLAGVVSWRVSEGGMIPDEQAYRFQALTLASGRLMAPAPPGAPEKPLDRLETPRPIFFEHEIMSKAGWYFKYPIGWPAVLALPERMGVGWIVSPLLGALLLLVTGAVAREMFGEQTVWLAVAMSALSPFYLANSVGRLSHTLAALLVAAASLFCIQGLKTGKLSRFIWMLLLLVGTYQVRPLTAFTASVVLGLGSLIATRDRRALCARVAAMSALAAALAVASFLLYNWLYTGNALVTPYAARGGVPPEMALHGVYFTDHPLRSWRFGVQSTVLFAFPFLGLLVFYYFWSSRTKSAASWILVALACAIGAYPLGSGSIIGQRYWFEGYFAVVVLAAEGLTRLLAAWRPGRRVAVPVAACLAIAQLAMFVPSIYVLGQMSSPRREVKRLADGYRNCDCVVYFAETPPDFYGFHLNINNPDWPTARVFYANDPGPDQRAKWTGILRRSKWVVLRYDIQRQTAVVDGEGSI